MFLIFSAWMQLIWTGTVVASSMYIGDYIARVLTRSKLKYETGDSAFVSFLIIYNVIFTWLIAAI